MLEKSLTLCHSPSVTSLYRLGSTHLFIHSFIHTQGQFIFASPPGGRLEEAKVNLYRHKENMWLQTGNNHKLRIEPGTLELWGSTSTSAARRLLLLDWIMFLSSLLFGDPVPTVASNPSFYPTPCLTWYAFFAHHDYKRVIIWVPVGSNQSGGSLNDPHQDICSHNIHVLLI